MFVGTHPLSLDDKGRIILPVKFRDALKDGAYVTKSVDGCLGIYPAEDFESFAAELKEKVRSGVLERTAMRAFMANAAEVTPDRQGRITIPQPQREYAELRDAVVVTGFVEHIEVWSAQNWPEVESRGSSELAGAGSDLADLL
jgi:MraZ protein